MLLRILFKKIIKVALGPREGYIRYFALLAKLANAWDFGGSQSETGSPPVPTTKNPTE